MGPPPPLDHLPPGGVLQTGEWTSGQVTEKCTVGGSSVCVWELLMHVERTWPWTCSIIFNTLYMPMLWAVFKIYCLKTVFKVFQQFLFATYEMILADNFLWVSLILEKTLNRYDTNSGALSCLFYNYYVGCFITMNIAKKNKVLKYACYGCIVCFASVIQLFGELLVPFAWKSVKTDSQRNRRLFFWQEGTCETE